MKKQLMILMAGLALTGAASETSKLVKTRSAKSAEVEPGKWHSNFSKCKAYAVANKVPLIAVWSNGESCSHCVRFESCCNSTTFKNWMVKSGCVFYFTYPGDGGDGKIGSSVFHWIRNNKNTSYPFVRIYWPAGKVDVATVGDTLDQYESSSKGAKLVVNYLKAKVKKFVPCDPKLPYQIAFNANFPTTDGTTGRMDERIDATYGTAVTLTANAFACSNFVFAGWAKSTTGTVAFKDKASVQGLTTASNNVVTLYARWTRTTYGPYYTGVKKTIKVTNYAGTAYTGYTPASKIAGLTWNKSKGYWTGAPTKAGTYTVKFKKSSSSITRTFVILKDEVEIDGFDVGADGKVETDTSINLNGVIGAVSGDSASLKSVKAEGLPAGLELKDGAIVGRPTTPGTYPVTVTIVTKNSQTVKKELVFEVAEGNAILLDGLAHADELWAEEGDAIAYEISVKVKHPDGSYDLLDGDGAIVSVVDSTGSSVSGLLVLDGRLVGTLETPGEYTVTVAKAVDGQDLYLTFALNVLASADPE